MTANPFAALLDGVPRYDGYGTFDPDGDVVRLSEVLAALAAAVPADLAEAGEVLDEIRRVDPFENPLAASEAEQRAADTITALIARLAAQEAQIKGLEAERDDAVVKRAAWELEAKTLEPALVAERAKTARLVEAADWQEKQRRDAFARRHLNAPEDVHVAVLCERYGYGAVMDAASRLWARKDSIGAFYIGGCIGISPNAAIKEAGK